MPFLQKALPFFTHLIQSGSYYSLIISLHDICHDWLLHVQVRLVSITPPPSPMQAQAVCGQGLLLTSLYPVPGTAWHRGNTQHVFVK